MQRRLLTFVATIAVVCTFIGVVGCATIVKGTSATVSINSVPGGANVEIKTSDGIVVRQGSTSMTTDLKKGKDYIVSISLDGYESQTVPILKGDIEFGTAVCGNILCTGLIGLFVDHFSGAMYKLEPNTIIVSLQEVTAQNGGDTAIYAFLTVVGEDGTPQYAAVEMTPVAAD